MVTPPGPGSVPGTAPETDKPTALDKKLIEGSKFEEYVKLTKLEVLIALPWV